MRTPPHPYRFHACCTDPRIQTWVEVTRKIDILRPHSGNDTHIYSPPNGMRRCDGSCAVGNAARRRFFRTHDQATRCMLRVRVRGASYLPRCACAQCVSRVMSVQICAGSANTPGKHPGEQVRRFVRLLMLTVLKDTYHTHFVDRGCGAGSCRQTHSSMRRTKR